MIVTGGEECIYEEWGQTIVRIELDEYDLFEAAREYNETDEGLAPNRTGDDDMDEFLCPNCGGSLLHMDCLYVEEKPNFCSRCGTKINWNERFLGKVVYES